MKGKKNSRLLFGLSVLLLIFCTACGAPARKDAAAERDWTQPASELSADMQSENAQETVSPESTAEETAYDETADEVASKEAVSAIAAPDNPTAEGGETIFSAESGFSGGQENDAGQVLEDGSYSQKEEVAEYLHLYGHLPDNYITKREARDLGWDSAKGNLWDVAPGKSIGGDHFGNYEGLLPEEDDRDYFECDIDYRGGRRNAKRIIYSNDGLIFYTEDHYASFEQLYGD